MDMGFLKRFSLRRIFNHPAKSRHPEHVPASSHILLIPDEDGGIAAYDLAALGEIFDGIPFHHTLPPEDVTPPGLH